MASLTFGSLLDEIDALSDERQQELLEIVHRRRAEKRRHEIAANARQARELYARDGLPRGSVDEMMRSMETEPE